MMDGDDIGSDDESKFSISSLSLASRSIASRRSYDTRSLASRSLETRSLATQSLDTRSLASRSLDTRSITSRSITSLSTVRARNRTGRNRLRSQNNNSSHDGIISWNFVKEHRNLIYILLATYAIHSRKYQIHNFFFSTGEQQHYYKTINTKELTETYHFKSVSDVSFDATAAPSGYPFHRWGSSSSSSSPLQLSGYPLHVDKFVSILRHMGKGDRIKVPFEHGLKAQSANEDFVRLSGISFPYLVRNGKVLRPYGKKNRWKRYKWHSQGHHIDWVTLLESAVSMAKILEDKNPRMKLITQGDFPIIFDEFDWAWCGDDQVPIFRLTRNEQECSYAWPSLSQNYILPERKQWLKDTPADWDFQFQDWSNHYPWTSKKDKAVWRGRYVGHRDLYNQGILPRELLVVLAASLGDIMDVHPESWKSYPESQTGKVVEESKDTIPFEEFMQYKAVIDIEGSGSTRFGHLLCTNSVVIQVKPKSGAYWSHELEPWTHYIPVKEDMSDLKHGVEFALKPKNSAQVQGIIKNANAWCKRKMVWETHVLDFLWTLLAYAEILDKAPRFNDRWKGENDAYNLPSLEMAEFDGELLI